MYCSGPTGERNEEAFFQMLDLMAIEIKKRDDFVVVFHHDADGCAAGAIAVKALQREGKKVLNICLKQLYKENISEIKALGKNFLFVDFGSGQLDYLIEAFDDNFFVLDHHQPPALHETLIKSRRHVNPMLFGINGGTELSGAGVTFFFALALNKKNFDLSVLAVIGALGDMQDFNANSELIGLNKKALDIAVKNKLIEVKKDLRLYGRVSRPLVSFLVFSSNPVLPGLTANEDNCKAFFQQLSIPLKDSFTDRWLSYNDLSEEHRRELTSALILLLAENNMPEWKIKELVGDVYTFKKENPLSPLSDGKEFATLLNACGRNKRSDIALAVCMGNRKEAYFEALSLMDQHRENLRKGIQFIQQNGIEEKKSYYFFDAKETIDESIVGIIAGMLYGSMLEENKPIIALARNHDGTVKASGRATSALVRRGLNLGKAFKEIGLEIEGVEGGGHRIAGGAKIPLEKINLFLKLLEKKFEEQLNISTI
ncbi:MAG: DHH family phosphoesterase [archaeon]